MNNNNNNNNNVGTTTNIPIYLNKTTYSIARFSTSQEVDFSGKEVKIYKEPKEIVEEPQLEVKRKTKKNYIKRKRPEAHAWIIETPDGDFNVVPEQGLTSKFFLLQETNGGMEASEVDSWYIVRNQMKPLKSKEQIEEEMKKRLKKEAERFTKLGSLLKDKDEEGEGKDKASAKSKKKAEKARKKEEESGESFDYKNEVQSDEEEDAKSNSDVSESESDSSSSSSDDEEEKERLKQLLKTGPEYYSNPMLNANNETQPHGSYIEIKKERSDDLPPKRHRPDDEPDELAPSLTKKRKRDRELTEKEVIEVLRKHPKGLTPSGLAKRFPTYNKCEDKEQKAKMTQILKDFIRKVARSETVNKNGKDRATLFLKEQYK